MNKAAQYMVKAAQLRAQAIKLEKVAASLLEVGFGAGALSLLGSGVPVI